MQCSAVQCSVVCAAAGANDWNSNSNSSSRSTLQLQVRPSNPQECSVHEALTHHRCTHATVSSLLYPSSAHEPSLRTRTRLPTAASSAPDKQSTVEPRPRAKSAHRHRRAGSNRTRTQLWQSKCFIRVYSISNLWLARYCRTLPRAATHQPMRGGSEVKDRTADSSAHSCAITLEQRQHTAYSKALSAASQATRHLTSDTGLLTVSTHRPAASEGQNSSKESRLPCTRPARDTLCLQRGSTTTHE